MKRFVVTLLFIAASARAETVAITGADVWTNTAAAPLKNATIIITDGRIVSLDAGDASTRHAPPVGARILKADGMVVTPPLDAAATQIGLVEVASASDTDDRSVSSGNLGAAFDVSLGIDANDLTIQQARAAGVRRALVFPGAAGNGIFAGQGARLNLGGGADLVERPRASPVAPRPRWRAGHGRRWGDCCAMRWMKCVSCVAVPPVRTNRAINSSTTPMSKRCSRCWSGACRWRSLQIAKRISARPSPSLKTSV